MKLFSYLFSLFPTRLPIGIQEFNDWATCIRSLVGPGFEQVPEDVFNFVLSNNIIHLGPQASRVPKNYFVKAMHKGAANQVASQIFQDVKSRQKAAEDAAKAVQDAKTQPAEVTAQPAGTTDETKVQASH
jgi:thiamine pyrophosphate-dependent acetolactate synthase large subunit-like protein